jgi:hypothetical protein
LTAAAPEPAKPSQRRNQVELDTLSISIPVPAVQGYFGKRIATYTTQIQPLQIKRILGHDPRSKNWKLLPPSKTFLADDPS